MLARVREQCGDEDVQKAVHHATWCVGVVGETVFAAHRMMQPRRRLERQLALGAGDDEARNLRWGGKRVRCYAARAKLGVEAVRRDGVQKWSGVVDDGDFDEGGD